MPQVSIELTANGGNGGILARIPFFRGSGRSDQGNKPSVLVWYRLAQSSTAAEIAGKVSSAAAKSPNK
jgi:hypothetical protein